MRKCGVALAIVICALMISCGLFGPTVPAELSGTWSKTNSSGYVEEFTFSMSTIAYRGYSQAYPGQFDASYDAKIVEIFEGEGMLRTEDDMYFAWHIEGDILYLFKTNPYSEKPVLGASWWTTGSGYRTLNRS
jgi:hypothetical protein